MHKRFTELYQQATDHAVVVTKLIDMREFQTVLAKKFAELIVEDCCSVLVGWKGEPFPFDEDLAVSLIKEHFGAK